MLMAAMVMHLIIDAVRKIWEYREYSTSSRETLFDEYHRLSEDLNFERFSNSMNLAFGLTNYDADWDILQNPFVEFRGHIISTGMKISNSLDLHVCSEEEKLKFLPQHTLIWYTQALCITNRRDAVVRNNWFL